MDQGPIEQAEQYGASNYHPLPVVITRGEGAWVWDDNEDRYLDMLSAYSALNQGHCHPRIVEAAVAQLGRVTLTSRAFHNDQLGPFLQRLAEVTGLPKALPMNSGAEAVETAIKAMRKWGYTVRDVRPNRALIIVAANNFHGRTVGVISFSTEAQYRDGFGPFTPGFMVVPFGDLQAMAEAITADTVAVLLEPIQAEAGIILPPEGYLRAVRDLCDRHGLLLCLDEIQTGLGRTGRMWAHQYEGIWPDCLCVGKALSGGILPVSAFCATKAVMDVFTPGDHGSTFGGNPLAAAVGLASLNVLVDENLATRAAVLGAHAMERLGRLKSRHIVNVRGRGLLIGIELNGPARPVCEALMARGVLCKETHDRVIRLAPPLVIFQKDLDWGLDQVEAVLTA